ncbi:MAG TPA: DEAD/DEAH box helicase [Clostridiales bacterium]|nr:DEAD/DEAH box helicase [Clostridiales bacterium]
MELNKLQLEDEYITLITKTPLLEKITREFTEYELDLSEGMCLYKFEPMPNMCFALRALLAKYKHVFSANKEVLNILAEQTKFATMPTLSLYSTKAHVQIQCPPLNYYLDLVAAVGAASKGLNTYTVPIARAFDVIRAAEITPNFLPAFMIAKNLREEIIKPIKGFDGSIASLFTIPLEELHAASRAYRAKPENFKNVGYNVVADFLFTQPRRYIDKTKITSHTDLEIREPVNLIGKIIEKELIYFKHVKITIRVGKSTFECMFYHRSWMIDKFNYDDEVLIMGEYQGRGKIAGQSIESLVEMQALNIVPIYSQSAKNYITSKIVLNVVYEAIARIKPYMDKLTPYIDPKEMRMTFGEAINEMHFPSSSESYVGALETLALYELIYLQLMIADRKANEVKDKGVSKPRVKNGYFDAMIKGLPWELTPAQKEGLRRMDEYMSTETSEQVLLSADVGAGKTILAQLSCMQALDNGYQSALAAPTEILATQLYNTFVEMVELMPESMRPTLAFMGGKLKVKEKRELLKYIKSGDIDVIIGTHSVLNKDIEYKNLGLVIIDEQQKFGAAQRESLLESRSDGKKPDLLSQTATPIPRSTAQAFYGDIDLISLMGKPKGRIEIKTEWIKEDPKLITKNKNHNVWKDVTKEVRKGHQVFIVVPMVYESKKMDSASVEGAYKDLMKILPEVKIGFTHGSLKKSDKQGAMDEFREGNLDVLVASTVIEVGVDVPNATRIVILSADRLGASSLHQIRGRVGRSNLPSVCYLVSEGKTHASKTRLQALVDSTDGFEIAKVDLKTRGEGDLFGLRQAGESTLRFSNLVDHSKLVRVAQNMAKSIYESSYKDLAIKDAQAILGEEEEIII